MRLCKRSGLPLILMILFLNVCAPALTSAQHQEDLEFRKFRVTLVPGLSTNGINAPDYSAKYSLNLIAGYHGGLEGFEMGLVNINRRYAQGAQVGVLNATGGEMSGFQFASLANLAGGDMQGIQAGSLLNLARGGIQGLQFSGLANAGGESLQGLHFSGLFNAAGGSMQGLQFAGLANLGREYVQGLQFAGLANFSGGDMQGLQFAGLTNTTLGDMQGLVFSGTANINTGEAQGIFMAGTLNYAESMQGLSFSGVANYAQNMTGIQMSGVANIANRAQGIQVSTFNYARDFEGVPVGLVSYYGNGRKNIDFWASDGGFVNLGLKTGTRSIYNMISAGYNPLITDRTVWTVGWTIGTYRPLHEAWNNPRLTGYFRQSDLNIQKINENGWSRTPRYLFSYRYTLGRDLHNRLSVYAGPSLNLLISRRNTAADYTWYSILDRSGGDLNYRFWVGFSVGFQFFGH